MWSGFWMGTVENVCMSFERSAKFDKSRHTKVAMETFPKRLLLHSECARIQIGLKVFE